MPQGVNRSWIFQLVSGGDVTSARLFSKISGHTEILGLVGYWDVVAWDEYEQQKGKTTDAVLIDTMQNYLANKTFNRGKATHEASASMAFVGNTKHTVPYMLKNSHLFESIPTGFIKGAFLDRIHLYNPGWEIKSLRKDSFSKGYGLITDYIAAVLHELRALDFSPMLKDYARFDTSLSERDHLAIRKTFSGLVKLLYPDGKMTTEEALEIVDFAGESRKRVKDQLYIIDETFRADKPATFEYLRIADGKTVKVETLENVENGIVAPIEEVPEEPETSVPGDERTRRPRISQQERIIAPRHIAVRANQKGITYKSLFGEYLKGATQIEIIDPYIRAPFQIDNLIEFINLIREANTDAESIAISLNTNNTDDKIPEMIDIFDALTDDLATYGIEFTYTFEADHDRAIILNNGWTINLSRGLDIFEKFDRFSIAAARQTERRCREFSMTINETANVKYLE